MYKLKLKKALSYTGIVSATKEKPYVTVEDEATVNAAVASGFFEIVEVTETEKPKKTVTGTVGKLDVMTVPQLKEYAKTNNIDLTGASKKEEILERIEAAQAAQTPPPAGDGEDDPADQFTGNDGDGENSGEGNGDGGNSEGNGGSK
nr:MAG TPA: endoplasmic reticulum chaperone [Caudoviricetes sp.]